MRSAGGRTGAPSGSGSSGAAPTASGGRSSAWWRTPATAGCRRTRRRCSSAPPPSDRKQLVEGRTLQETDAANGFRGLVVSRAYAERWWPDGGAIGKRIIWGGPDGEWWQIVGVVENTRYRGLQEDPEEMLFLPTTF